MSKDMVIDPLSVYLIHLIRENPDSHLIEVSSWDTNLYKLKTYEFIQSFKENSLSFRIDGQLYVTYEHYDMIDESIIYHIRRIEYEMELVC